MAKNFLLCFKIGVEDLFGEKMKVNFIQNNIVPKAKAPDSQPGKEVGLYRDDRRYNAGYCGSFTGKSETATTFLDKILKSNWFGKFAKYSHDHNISTTALVALVLAGIMRPATIMALPGKKDKDDKTYAAGHSMASGIIGFVFSTILTSPFDESIKKVFDENGKFAGPKLKALNDKIKEYKTQEKNNELTKEGLKNLKKLVKKQEAMRTLLKNIPDWIIAVPRAMLTIALIPPILKYVFGLEKKKSDDKSKEQSAQQTVQTKDDIIDKPVFAAFKGGVQ